MMKVYQISYELRKQRDYTTLYEQIRGYGTCRQILASSWVMVTDQSITQIRDDLAKTIDRGDKLMVARLQGEAAWRKLGDESSQWLKNQLGPRIA